MTDINLSDEIDQMKAMSEMLIPYTFPAVDFKIEQEILLLKQRTLVVDGYEMLVIFSKAKYEEYFLESVQLYGTFAPFLPFTMVCKLGRAFLGSYNLSYIEFFKGVRKVYCWTIRSRDGRSLPPDTENEPGCFEGFEYSILQPGTVDLF
jgi:hypothetical protein